MLVVLFYQRGIMGKNEFSWDGLLKWCKKLINQKKKTSVKGGLENGK
jgi:maltose-binding protein MalE